MKDMIITALTFLLVIGCSVEAYQINQAKGCNDDYQLDYIKLATQWSSGVCATTNEDCERGNHVNNFTIHGFWPCKNSNPMLPNFCCFDRQFNYTALQPISHLLMRNWYGYFGKDELKADKKFWEHEWTKHGTCTRDIEYLHGELNYFKTTLDMFLNLPIVQTLSEANISPDNGKTYKASAIMDALRKINNGKLVEIECAFEHGHQPVPDVTGINFCYDSRLKPTNCPASKGRCRGDLTFKKSS